MSALAPPLAAVAMSRRLTEPFARGGDTLELSLVARDAATAAIAAYDFSEHVARFGRQPDPRYVLVCERDVEVATTVTVGWRGGGRASVVVPAGSLAGSSVALPLGGPPPPPGPQLTTLTADPPAADGRPELAWGLTALIGNLAKLLWVGGWERDRIRRELTRVAEQRRRTAAAGRSLDLLGHDLGVPRFVPLAYSYDPDALALLHLDDPVRPAAGQPDAEDRLARYRPVAHHGVNAGRAAEPGAPGRFGSAWAFRASAAELQIADHAELALGARASFTAECFYKPDDGADGHLLSKQARPGSASDPGWTLTIGEFGRGLPLNVRWQLSDGARAVALFADVTLDGGRFHHLAGSLDRAAGVARLHVDGELRAEQPLGPLAALTSAAPLRLGRHGGAGAAGVVDELRLSAVARTRFHPVLGESDDSYRRRLGVFERWTLPSPANVQRALNDAVGPIDGVAEPLVVDDTPATLVAGTAAVRLLPGPLPAGAHVDALGDRRSGEADVAGTADDEERRLGSAWLTRLSDPRADYAPPPQRTLEAGEEPPDATLAHARAAAALGALLDLLRAARTPARLLVRAAFDPRAPDLRAVGRGLLLDHAFVPRGELAALAHQAGFDWVRHRGDLRAVQAVVRRAERLTIALAPAPPPGRRVDFAVGELLTATVSPPLPSGARVEWVTIACGRGRARFESATTAASARLRADSPGGLTLRVEATWRGLRASGTRTLRIGPADLADGATIAADGTLGAPATVADSSGPEPFLHPVHLLHLDDPRPAYGAGDGPHRLQRGTATRLRELLDMLEESGVRGQLTVHEAWDPAVRDLRARGRRLVVSHPRVAAGALAARAHAAGFAWVRRDGARVELRHGEEELLEISAPAPLAEGAAGPLLLTQQADARAVAVTAAAVWSVNAGSDSVSELEPKRGAVQRALKVGHRPVAVAIDPAGRRLYSADQGSGTVSVVDLAAGTLVASIAVGARPSALLHHPRLARLYVACAGDATVRAIDTGTNAVVATVAVGPGAPRLALTRDGRRLWALSDGESAARILTAEPLAAAGQLALPGRAADVALAAGADRGWIALADRAELLLVRQDVAALDRTVALALPAAALALADGDAALYALVRADADGADSVGLVLDAAGAEQSRFPLARRTAGLTAAGAGRRLYAAVRDVGVAALELGPAASVALVGTWPLGSGLGEQLTWIGRPFGGARGRIASATRPETRLTAERAGPLMVRLVAALGDHGSPYSFEVRLAPALDRPATVIGKEQYDLLMNVLNLLHPIGVEVRTRAIREHVLEVREGLLEAFPDYTYPNFRVPGPTPVAPAQEG